MGQQEDMEGIGSSFLQTDYVHTTMNFEHPLPIQQL